MYEIEEPTSNLGFYVPVLAERMKTLPLPVTWDPIGIENEDPTSNLGSYWQRE